MENFTRLTSLGGGVLIGLSAALLLLGIGRIAGVSGIFGGLVIPRAGDLAWRAAFVLGLAAGGFGLFQFEPALFATGEEHAFAAPGVAGLLVGYGTRLSNGCTSGHGVCGLGRLSARSLVATLTFMVSGAVTVFLSLHVLGGFR